MDRSLIGPWRYRIPQPKRKKPSGGTQKRGRLLPDSVHFFPITKGFTCFPLVGKSPRSLLSERADRLWVPEECPTQNRSIILEHPCGYAFFAFPRLGLRVCSSKKPLHNCKTIDVLVQHTRPNETFLWEHSRYMHLIFYFSTVIIISHDQLMIAAGHLPTPPHSPDGNGWVERRKRPSERETPRGSILAFGTTSTQHLNGGVAIREILKWKRNNGDRSVPFAKDDGILSLFCCSEAWGWGFWGLPTSLRIAYGDCYYGDCRSILINKL